MNVPDVLQTRWWRRIIHRAQWLVGSERIEPESIFARNGENRWTTPRQYESPDARVVSWRQH